jgi:hypothetical protein
MSAGCLQTDDEQELRALAVDWQLRVAAGGPSHDNH